MYVYTLWPFLPAHEGSDYLDEELATMVLGALLVGLGSRHSGPLGEALERDSVCSDRVSDQLFGSLVKENG